jgi:hypothetical protein
MAKVALRLPRRLRFQVEKKMRRSVSLFLLSFSSSSLSHQTLGFSPQSKENTARAGEQLSERA